MLKGLTITDLLDTRFGLLADPNTGDVYTTVEADIGYLAGPEADSSTGSTRHRAG